MRDLFDDVRVFERLAAAVVLVLLALAFLAGRCTAQHPAPVRGITPFAWQAQFHPAVVPVPAYRPGKRVFWAVFDPSVADPFVSVGVLGRPVSLHIVEAAILHGVPSCSDTILVSSWCRCPQAVWPATGSNPEVYASLTGNEWRLSPGSSYHVEHGEARGPCWARTRPLLVAVLLEVR